jgi:hypothetical protein
MAANCKNTSAESARVPSTNTANIDPTIILEDLKQNASVRKVRTLHLLYELLEQQSLEAQPDYSIATIGKLSEKRGGPSAQSIRNKGGADYRRLIEAWAHSKGATTRRPRSSDTALPAKAEDLLSKIGDPALRAAVGTIIAERNRYLAEMKVLKSQTEFIVDLRRTKARQQQTSGNINLSDVLTELEREALAYAASPEMLVDNGWAASDSGRVKNRAGRTVLKAGFLSAVEKLVALTQEQEA